MPRRRPSRQTYRQMTFEEAIADMGDNGTEHIRGAVPIDPVAAEARRDDFYRQLVAKTEELHPVICMPDFGVHVYSPGRSYCVCKELRRTQIKELQ